LRVATVSRFFAWCEHHQLGQLADIEPLHVAAYIEALGKDFEKPTVKQHLAAIGIDKLPSVTQSFKFAPWRLSDLPRRNPTFPRTVDLVDCRRRLAGKGTT
jgi:hypothetical protein